MSGGRDIACLTMHQPWASLLVYGIKRIEGRNWPTPLRGRLWIHSASKVPDTETIKAMEDYYKKIYAVDGITDLKFPEHYPVSRLLGCVEVVGCVKCEELVCWEAVPKGVKLEGLTNFCWLCETPQRILVPLVMRGNQGVYDLDKKIYETAVRGLSRVEGPKPVSFPLPDPEDPLSLKPGFLAANSKDSKISKSNLENPPSLMAAIAGARAAATQFSRKKVTHQTNFVQGRYEYNSSPRQQLTNKFIEGGNMSTTTSQWKPQERNQRHIHEQQNTTVKYQGNNYHQANTPQWRPQQRDFRQNYKEQMHGRGNYNCQPPSRGATQGFIAQSNISNIEDRISSITFQQRVQERESQQSGKEKSIRVNCKENGDDSNEAPYPRLAPPSKIFKAALRGVRPNSSPPNRHHSKFSEPTVLSG